jgi:hypothetical protein
VCLRIPACFCVSVRIPAANGVRIAEPGTSRSSLIRAP